MRRTAGVAALSLALTALGLSDSYAAGTTGKDQACLLEQSSGEMRCYASVREMVDVESGGRYELPASGQFSHAEVAKFNTALAAEAGMTGRRAARSRPA